MPSNFDEDNLKATLQNTKTMLILIEAIKELTKELKYANEFIGTEEIRNLYKTR